MFTDDTLLTADTIITLLYVTLTAVTKILYTQDEKSKGKEPSGILPSLIKFVTAVFFISLTFVFKADFESFFGKLQNPRHYNLIFLNL